MNRTEYKELKDRINDEIKPHKILNKNTLLICTHDELDGDKKHKITIDDVVEYYATQANNIVSGIRKLGNIVGDWRPVDHIAKFCLEVFKQINIEELRKKSINRGLTPRF